MNIADKSLKIFDENNSLVIEQRFPKDAFYYVFDDLRRSVIYNHQPFTSIDKALNNVIDIFLIYEKAKEIEILDKTEYSKIANKNGKH